MNPRPITTLCHKLGAWTSDAIPSQRQVYAAAVSARIPVKQLNRQWHYYEEDREAILKGLGLQPKEVQSDSTSQAGAFEHANA